VEHVDDPRFWCGVEHFDAGDYFAAHEVWEELWRELDGTEKEFLGGLIQAAVGYLKRERGVRNGAQRLWTRALGRLSRLAGKAPIDVDRLCARLRADLAALAGAPEPQGRPRINRTQ